MNSMREGMLMVDDYMTVVSSNRAAREIFKKADGRVEASRLIEVTRNPSVHAAKPQSSQNPAQAPPSPSNYRRQ